ncbi:MAG: MogA/MoaB family molybdenum cofactor biosynthesis protein [Elusimicrobia bacterium]|nr:MogA/MoaB family molybdenum cofactor biosynthesis protein [Elusimicrobiota bacterium]
MEKAAIIVISDSASRKLRQDLSGKKILKFAEKDFDTSFEIIPDDREEIKKRLIYYSDTGKAALILTTGGTGLGPRDVTPEATSEVSDKIVPGLAELMRAETIKKTKRAALSRGICALRGRTLIINLPGSPRAVEECLSVVWDLIPHALDMIKGKGHRKLKIK